MPLDYALGTGFYQWRGECLVRLGEEYRQTVVLIGTGEPGSDDAISPWGTGFIVGDVSSKSTYLVTAWHVVADKTDAPFDVRFNNREGGARLYRVEYPNWVTHESDDTIDVAIHELVLPDWAEIVFIPMEDSLLAAERIEGKNIGPGTRTYTVGLWKFLHGDRRNQPFVYTGHIGLMPEDQRIPVKSWLRQHGNRRVLVEAFLVEGEPLDGASGSPVFVRRTFAVDVNPKGSDIGVVNEATVEGSIWCLGLFSDIFVAKPGRDYDPRMSGTIPRGVNIVVPSTKIRDVLDHPKLKSARDAKLREAEGERLPMKASAPSTTADNPSHKEDFNRLLGAAVRKPRQDD